MRIKVWTVLACALAVLSTGCSAPAPPSEATVSFVWAYRAGDYVRGTPTVSDGVVYVGADDNVLHAIDGSTGASLWQYETADNVTSSPLIRGNVVYFGSWDGSVYALDRTRGALRWQYETD
jgi:outer membrane protein assembly factor BamB